MDYIATFFFVVIVAVGGWYYGCKVNTWCGVEPDGVPLTEVLSEVATDTVDAVADAGESVAEAIDEATDGDAASEEVAAATCSEEYFTKDIKPGASNDKAEVIKLEKFLNEYEGEKLIAGGVYDGTDQAAVKRFQEKYKADILEPAGLTEPNGMVLEGTRKKLNEIYCAQQKKDTEKSGE